MWGRTFDLAYRCRLVRRSRLRSERSDTPAVITSSPAPPDGRHPFTQIVWASVRLFVIIDRRSAAQPAEVSRGPWMKPCSTKSTKASFSSRVAMLEAATAATASRTTCSSISVRHKVAPLYQKRSRAAETERHTKIRDETTAQMNKSSEGNSCSTSRELSPSMLS
jgi:hypothetical protein